MRLITTWRWAVIIFSKTYCPYSKRAKGVLLEKYVIEPKPYVFELDTAPLGPQIQARLAGMTGRKTVPNISMQISTDTLLPPPLSPLISPKPTREPRAGPPALVLHLSSPPSIPAVRRYMMPSC